MRPLFPTAFDAEAGLGWQLAMVISREPSAYPRLSGRMRLVDDNPPDDRSRIDHVSSRQSMAAEIFDGLLLIFFICVLGFGLIALVGAVHSRLFIFFLECMLVACVICLVVAVGLVFAHQAGHNKRRLAPFEARNRLQSTRMYEEFSRSSSFSLDEVAAAWKKVADALDMDPALLRPSDRFDTDFKSFKVPLGESELTELEFTLIWAGKCARSEWSLEKTQTVGDAVIFLCACEQAVRGERPLV